MEMAKHCRKIDKKLLPVKLHYFLFMGALACVLPFRAIFAKQLGISATAVGVIFCAVPFFKTVTNPLFGFILDYFKRFRLTLSVIMIFVAVSHLAMVLIPKKILMPIDRINITENDFHSKLRYSCLYDNKPSVCDPKFVIYNEYRVPDNPLIERNSFTCDMQCFDSRNDVIVNNKENVRQCNKKMKFEFKVLVDISSCDMNVRLESGRMAILDDSIKNSVSVNINESSVRELKSWILSSENCSVELTQSKPFSSKINHEIEKKLSDRNQSREANILEAFDYVRKYVYTGVSESLDNDMKRYYALNEYTFNLLSENFYMDPPCSLAFDCLPKKCVTDAKEGEFNSEQLMAEENEFLSAQFGGLFMLIALSSVMFSAIMFIMDTVCYELLQDRREKYGQQRLWGTIGWGMGALVGGCVNQVATTDSGEIDYASSFYLLAVLTLIDLIPVYQLKVTDLKYSSHIWKDVCLLFSKIDIVYNMVIVYLIGVLSGFIWNYQFWFMQEIGSSQMLLGLSNTFECIFELPCFLVSGWIIKKIGHDHCNNITLLCFGLRYLCFVFMYNPWWTLAAGLFHGPTFGLFYASMTMYAKNEAPPGTEATVQSVLHLCFEGLGVATGSILGGLGLDVFGSRMSFMYAAELSFLLLFVNILMGISFSRTRRKPKQIKDSVSCA